MGTNNAITLFKKRYEGTKRKNVMCLRYLFSTSAKTLWRLFFDAVVQLNIFVKTY